MACEEMRRLVSEYETATKKFAEAVSDLQQRTGTSAKKEYDRLSRVSDEARIKSEQARLAVAQHVARHEC
jgi:hypothetical protein